MGPSDSDLIDRWRGAPAPLLGLLHAFHDRDGHLSDEALRAVAEGLRVPLADLYGTVSFYHHFSRKSGGRDAPRVCDGPVCKQRGSDVLLAELEGATPMPCAGRCDEPIPVLRGGQVLVGTPGEGLRAAPTPLPPPNPAEGEECCFAHVREEGRSTLAGYGGAYRALARARELGPEALLEELDASGLAGRGGAGFPTARKWRAVREAPGGPKTVVCNADEGEPGCFKDRVLMDHDPHAVLEGMAVAAAATGATRGFVYLRYEYPHTQTVLERAIDEARDELDDFEVCVRRGAGAYICGEETSLLNSLEGAHPFPRNRPPFPVTHGFEQTPTVVNNVETLASVPPIVERGADWYAGLGLGEQRGTKIISLSGDVRRPGNYEVPLGFPLHQLLFDWAGGPEDGRELQAVTMAGLSGGFLGPDDFAATLDEPCLRSRGSFLGAGGVMVFDDRRDMVDVARQAMAFFADESCGKCFPCRIGTQRLTERLAGTAGPTAPDAWRKEVHAIGETMAQVSACGLGIAAPLITESLLRLFPERVDEALARR
ncbi:MAG: NADH-ubiquinone oxidoreductase-F iron-sulfur binding region domain-containing protein [Planctomycetota bacterium]|nr:NADH-ubiquinone oxidoreductase-F iron-sulfur binding region domain-containing protein [Planctomycetota bacterium]MDP6761385.1 NADH-ubiquinone oxidoreductase-F iron-sulfur binding region domain-containing protein [Planctomycetota bacterium]MDP6989402.1 NADH-ubiquinone oxidoreductase-F iron-sulfur binding region domain-containing protein [Planctomycetota bacterium]